VRIANRASFLTDPIDGTIQNSEDGIEDTIENIERQIERWAQRLVTKQKQLESEFLSMEILTSQMQSMGQFVSAMISGL